MNLGIVFDIGSLMGVMALIVMLVNVGKLVGLVPDGSAPAASQALQAIAVIVLVALQVFGVEVAVIDAVAQSIADLGIALLALVPLFMQLNGIIHGELRGLPAVGFSHTE